MSTRTLDALLAEPEGGRSSLAVAFVVAVAVHVGLSAVVAKLPAKPAAPPPPVVTELDLAPLPPPPPPPPEPPREEPEAPEAPKVAQAPRAAAAAPPPLGKAANVMTAKPDPADKPAPADAPVDFVTDPNGGTFAGGVVARGGTADVGLRGGAAGGTGDKPVAPAVAPPAPKPAVVAGADLGRAPRLEEADACRGFYPARAESDSGVVTLAIVVRPGGDVQSVSVVGETPAGEGFGGAARQCLLSKRFTPGLDKEGNAVTSATTLRVRFSR